MQTALMWGQLFLGALVLYFGAEWLVKGAAGLARAFGMPPLIIGLTVVAYGTSAPELTVGVSAALSNQGAIALGNSIGSNIANLGLILGMTALISPPRVDGSLIRRELPVLVLTTLALPLVLLDGEMSRLDGALMILVAVVYSVWMIRAARRDPALGAEVTAAEAEAEAGAVGAGAPPVEGRGRMAAVALVGLVLLVVGGKVFVDAAVEIARAAGMSERVVGLTIVAVGTSLPELAASLVAALRGHSDIAVGNVIGSNIFNIVLILGGSALVRPLSGDVGAMTLDLAFLGGMTLLGVVFMRTARFMPRIEGAVFLMAYVSFLIALVVGG
ncbi:calcium/sodium antiporter [Myxococcota bacterium]|nr:calcium/sodium antiporter [Myxococcota bacterium]